MLFAVDSSIISYGEKMSETTKKQIDMINGPLFGKLVVFVIPLMLSGILQLLFNAADVIVVGQFADDGGTSLAAVSANGPLINLIVNLFIGLSVGANVVMARSIGARNAEKAEKVVHTSITISLIGGVIVALIGVFFAEPLLKLMKVDPEVLPKATIYVRIYLLGAPVGLLYNFGASILRAKGDTKRPLVVLIISGVINVGFNLIFVILLDMDAAGVALATTISQAFSAGAVVFFLMREKDYCKLSIKRLRITSEIKEIARVGVPAGVYGSFFSISNIVMQTAINSFGKVVTAGSSTAGNLEGFVYTSMNAVYNAAITFTGQNCGAKKYARVKTIVWQCVLITATIGLVMGGLMALLAPFFASLYTSDPKIIAVAVERLHSIMPIYFLCGTMEVFVGVLRGMGYSMVPMIVSFMGACVFRVVWVYTVFDYFHTLPVLYLSYPISWIVTALANAIILIFAYRRTVKRDKRESELSLDDNQSSPLEVVA